MLYQDEIKAEYLDRLKYQAERIRGISKILDYKNNREALTDSQIDKITQYVDLLETVKNELLKMYWRTLKNGWKAQKIPTSQAAARFDLFPTCRAYGVAELLDG